MQSNSYFIDIFQQKGLVRHVRTISIKINIRGGCPIMLLRTDRVSPLTLGEYKLLIAYHIKKERQNSDYLY